MTCERRPLREPGEPDPTLQILVVVCVGTKRRPHAPRDVLRFNRSVRFEWDWVPVHSGVRDGGTHFYEGRPIGLNLGKLWFPCPRRGCKFDFKQPAEEVFAAFDTCIRGVRHREVSLAELERMLSRKATTLKSGGVSRVQDVRARPGVAVPPRRC